MDGRIEPSNQDAVARDAAVGLLVERAVLTRAVCRELLEAGAFTARRPAAALGLLQAWIAERYRAAVCFEPRASDGLDESPAPPGCADLMLEVQAGSRVAAALHVFWTADNPLQAADDRRVLQKELDEYWAAHPTAAAAPRIGPYAVME
jgi:hypothetical protein